MKINHKTLKQLPGIIEIWNAYRDTDKKIYEMDYFNEFLDGALPLEIAQMLAPGFDAYRGKMVNGLLTSPLIAWRPWGIRPANGIKSAQH